MKLYAVALVTLLAAVAVSGNNTPKPVAGSKPAPPKPALPAAKPPGITVCDDSVTCNQLVAKYYSEINCTPVKSDKECCPSKFNCPSVTSRVPTKCHLKGVAYDQGKSVPKALVSNPCTKDCRCEKFGEVVEFHCATTECNEDVPAGCVALYKDGVCCPTIQCKNATSTGVTAPKKDAVTCQLDGKTYVEGERFPQSALRPCKHCTCQKGFKGVVDDSMCKEFSCDVELLYGTFQQRGCIPTYYGNKKCCPISWRCPFASDKVITGPPPPPPAPGSKPPAPAAKCMFGKLVLNIGDKLNPSNEDEECKCMFPPHVTCVQKEVAYDLDIILGQK